MVTNFFTSKLGNGVCCGQYLKWSNSVAKKKDNQSLQLYKPATPTESTVIPYESSLRKCILEFRMVGMKKQNTTWCVNRTKAFESFRWIISLQCLANDVVYNGNGIKV